jgi:hypothetical protein
MTHLAEMFSLTRIDWQFFGTFTFREPFLREHEAGQADARRNSMFVKWGRKSFKKLKYCERAFRKSFHCRRLEQGEIGGLWHLHFLMSGLEPRQVNIGTAKYMASQWRGIRGGHCEVEVFDKSQNGVDYISKCLDPNKRFEFNRFGLAQSLTFSPALLSVLRPFQQRSGFAHACRRAVGMHRFAMAKNSVSNHAEGLRPSALILNPA